MRSLWEGEIKWFQVQWKTQNEREPGIEEWILKKLSSYISPPPALPLTHITTHAFTGKWMVRKTAAAAA